MKKHICRILPIFMLLLWLCTITAFAADTPTVVYDSEKGAFAFHNLDNDSLFGKFQEIMPSDRRTTEIRIEMKNISRTARLYLRAEPNSDDIAVLESLTLSISQNGVTLDENNGANSLKQDVLLGTFTDDGDTVLEVTLTVPTTVGNEMARQSGELQWIFTVQEDGKDPIDEPVPSPSTGDNSHMMLYFVMLLISGASLLFLVLFRRKKQDE